MRILHTSALARLLWEIRFADREDPSRHLTRSVAPGVNSKGFHEYDQVGGGIRMRP